MKHGKFTAKERAYLMSLPAVESITQERIFYAQEFKIDCMRRYHEGDSPATIFSEAGLYSSLIGYKRIERCIARWRADEKSGRLVATQERNDAVMRIIAGDRSSLVSGSSMVPGSSLSNREMRWMAERRHARTVQDISGLVLMRYESRLRSLEHRLGEMDDRVVQLERELEMARAERGGTMTGR